MDMTTHTSGKLDSVSYISVKGITVGFISIFINFLILKFSFSQFEL